MDTNTVGARAQLDVLLRAREWLSDRRNWTQGIYVSESGQTCLVGAIYKEIGCSANGSYSIIYVTPEQRSVLAPISDAMLAVACAKYGKHPVDVNDYIGYEAAMDVLDTTIARLREQLDNDNPSRDELDAAIAEAEAVIESVSELALAV